MSEGGHDTRWRRSSGSRSGSRPPVASTARCKATTEECGIIGKYRLTCRCNKAEGHTAKMHESDHGYKWATEEE